MDTDTEVPLPKKYKPLKKMNIQILNDNWIIHGTEHGIFCTEMIVIAVFSGGG